MRFPSSVRRWRATTAISGALAVAALLPAGAAADTMYKAYDNGVLAYSTSDGAVHTIFQDGSNDTPVSVTTTDFPNGITGIANEWSVDGTRLLITGTDGDLHDVDPWAGTQRQEVDEPFDIRGASMSPDGTTYAFGSDSNGVTLWKAENQSTQQLLGGASDGTAWSNEDQLSVAFDGAGIYRFHNPVEN